VSTVRAEDRSHETGAIALEFAFVALAFFVLVFATIELGRATFLAQAAQAVARTAARELALVPLPAGMTFDEALDDPLVRERVYDDRWLVIDLDALDNPQTPAVESTIDELFATLPPVNRGMRTLMIHDRPVIGGVERRLLRAPGTLLVTPGPDARLTVQVPLVLERDGATGIETDVTWARVLEEVRPDRLDPAGGTFAVTAPAGGLVSVRVNVAFQSSSLTAHRESPAGPFEPNANLLITASDAAVLTDPDRPLDGAVPIGELAGQVGAYAGASGLGRTLAQTQVVRPFRRVLSAQAVFRRELVLP